MAKRPSWGHVSRHCIYCGKVGPRVWVTGASGGYAHRYCIREQTALNRPSKPPNTLHREIMKEARATGRPKDGGS